MAEKEQTKESSQDGENSNISGEIDKEVVKQEVAKPSAIIH